LQRLQGGPNLSSFFWLIAAIPAVMFVHEIGHLIVARWCGVRVAQLSVGFGPEIIGITDRFGTRWTLALVPLGGWTKYIDHSQSTRNASDGITNQRPDRLLKQHAAIYSAGALFNFLFAGIILVGTLGVFGQRAYFRNSIDFDAAFGLIIASLSVGVGLFNLLPIPPLDGWRLTSVVIEAVTKKPLPERLQQRLSLIGSSIIVTSTVFLAAVVASQW
jgi:membrane-associated protease RseP (regulator of RpoE activity)